MFYLNRECGYTGDVLQVGSEMALACVEHGVRISRGTGSPWERVCQNLEHHFVQW